MIVQLLQALKTYYTSHSDGIGLTGGIHIDLAPEGTQKPFGVYVVVSAPRTLSDYNTGKFADVRLQFTVYGIGLVNTSNIAESFVTFFENYLPLITGMDCSNVTLDTDLIPRYQDLDENDEPIYGIMMEFIYTVHKN